jgi:hypothetical protein
MLVGLVLRGGDGIGWVSGVFDARPTETAGAW